MDQSGFQFPAEDIAECIAAGATSFDLLLAIYHGTDQQGHFILRQACNCMGCNKNAIKALEAGIALLKELQPKIN
jgi:hypothetical protein